MALKGNDFINAKPPNSITESKIIVAGTNGAHTYHQLIVIVPINFNTSNIKNNNSNNPMTIPLFLTKDQSLYFNK